MGCGGLADSRPRQLKLRHPSYFPGGISDGSVPLKNAPRPIYIRGKRISQDAKNPAGPVFLTQESPYLIRDIFLLSVPESDTQTDKRQNVWTVL